MHWITVTDENGNDFDAQTSSHEDTGVSAWVYFDAKSGFGNDVGEIKLVHGLKKLSDGKYGA